MDEMNADIIIVGTGAAGLATALELVDQLKAACPSILFLEREKERLGGRVHNEEKLFDFGAAYLGPAQTCIWSMVERFTGAKLSGEEGDPDTERFLYRNYWPPESVSFYQGPGRPVQWVTGNYPLPEDAEAFVTRLEVLARAAALWIFKFGRPIWSMPGAQGLDKLNCRELPSLLLDTPPTAELLELVDIAVRSAFSVEATAMSALYLVEYSARCGGFQTFENVNGTGDSHRIREGMGWLLGQIWGVLKANGKVNLVQGDAARVRSIEQNDQGVVVTAASGTTYRAPHLVLALSPFVHQATAHHGNFAIGGNFVVGAQKALAAAMIPGLTRKLFVKYDRAFWRERGQNGYGLSHGGPIDWVMDNCADHRDEDGRWIVDTAALMVFIVADQVIPFMQKALADQDAAILGQLAVIFGPEALNGNVIHSDSPNMFCPAGVHPPGALTTHKVALREPNDRVYFAASELGINWPGGYVNGALESGRWAARRYLNDVRQMGLPLEDEATIAGLMLPPLAPAQFGTASPTDAAAADAFLANLIAAPLPR